jgi:SAM-dependent methyltransferase
MRNWIHQALESEFVYRNFQKLIVSRLHDIFLNEFARACSGERILDLGCGCGDALATLPEVEYVGLDSNRGYIERARRRWGSRGEFHVADFERPQSLDYGRFDLVLGMGVLHHLSDGAARTFLSLAAESVAPEGRLCTFDGCYDESQTKAEKFFVSHDRGRFVRTRPAYVKLAQEQFQRVESVYRHGLIRFPYSFTFLRCTEARPVQTPNFAAPKPELPVTR